MIGIALLARGIQGVKVNIIEGKAFFNAANKIRIHQKSASKSNQVCRVVLQLLLCGLLCEAIK